jgi:tetratricopeptide (TPR) repeat protein
VQATQRAHGSQIVQINDVSDSSIQITYAEQRRELPLERAVCPVGAGVRSPARLVRARSGVVPYAARESLVRELESWALGEGAFAGLVIGGPGGLGKTRLGVELCERVRQRPGWLCGLLQRTADQGATEALVRAPTPRLVVVDYAESRPDQLVVLVPLLRAHASLVNPVRVVLLVRARPRRGDDWTEPLRDHGDALDLALDDFQQRVLENVPLELVDRESLFVAAAHAFAARSDPPTKLPDVPAILGEKTFRSPLLVVIAAYLAVNNPDGVPASRIELLDGLLVHEDRYWHATAGGLNTDGELRARVVGLATLASANSEIEAVELLRMLPDLEDAPAERRGRLARWAACLYSGDGWWNPLEPDVLGERLAARCYSDQPEVLARVLGQAEPDRLSHSLGLVARAAVDYPDMTATLGAILTDHIDRLCVAAIAESKTTTGLALLARGHPTVAASLGRALGVVTVDRSALARAVQALPMRPNLVLNSLALELATQLEDKTRRLAEEDPAEYEPWLAESLDDFSNRLADVDRGIEALEASEESVSIFRRLAKADPDLYDPPLATALRNLSNRWSDVGDGREALGTIEAAVAIARRLAEVGTGATDPTLASVLHNLSVRLGDVGLHEQGLDVVQEAVEIRRRLAREDAAFEAELAASLNNLGMRLDHVRRHEDGHSAIQEAISMYRRLAQSDPVAYQPALAGSLNNLSVNLGALARDEQGVAPSEEALKISRQLATANPASYQRLLNASLNNLWRRLEASGHADEARRVERELAETRSYWSGDAISIRV